MALSIVLLTACDDDDVAIFDQPSDVRASEAIDNLKQELIAPSNGWIVRYRPERESGTFYVMMKFNQDNTVNIKTDLGNEDGTYFDHTVTYRIDNSLGLELIVESYSFFSYLFEQDMATYLAEYEFNYVNKTPDNALVFTSKTDPDVPTRLVLLPASEQDESLLARDVSTNLNTIAGDLNKFSSSLKLTYDNRDVILFMGLNNLRRIVTIQSASRKTNPNASLNVDFSTPYILKGDSIVFDEAYSSTMFGTSIAIKGIKFGALTDGTLDVCPSPITVHAYTGVTSNNDAVRIETSLSDAAGRTFTQSDFYFAPLEDIYENGVSSGARIIQEIPGALSIQLYYNYSLGGNDILNGIGFVIQNPNGTITFALKQFTPTLVENKLSFDFDDEFTYFGTTPSNPNEANMNQYLQYLTEGDNTYVFKLSTGEYEFHNPCTGWSFIFQDGN